MVYLAWFILGFLALRFFVSLSNLVAQQWLHERPLQDMPLISILIPARNEELSIAKLLQSIQNQDYANIEVYIYDDLSVDKTAEIIHQYTKCDPRFHYLAGKALPEGWLGKNHACYQLAKHAKGDFLLFLDADVQIKNGLIKNALAHLKKYELQLFSIFPKQIMHSFGEKITVPLMNWILLSLLPLFMIRLSKRKSFAAANGQFMLFNARTYHKQQFHDMVKSHKVEDIVIMRLMKEMGYKCHTLASNGQIECRMYQGFNEAVQGFAKNVFEFFGGNMLIGSLFALITTFGFVPIIFFLPYCCWIIYGSLILLKHLNIAVISRQPILFNTLLIFVKQFIFFFVIVNAIQVKMTKKYTWKGRKIN